MTKIPTVLPSRFLQVRQLRATHAKAMASRMTRIPMVADPYLEQCDPTREAAPGDHRARRACQYAGWLGQRAGKLPADLSGLNALWCEADGFAVFTTADEEQSVAAVIPIPRHVLDFDPGTPALALPPVTEVAETSRCADTADMLARSPPTMIAPPSSPQAVAARSARVRRNARRGQPANDNCTGRAVTTFCLPRGSVAVDFTIGGM